jgi:hypothetical protein
MSVRAARRAAPLDGPDGPPEERTKMTARCLPAIVLTAGVLVLAGCGGSSRSAAPSSTTTTPASSTASSTPATSGGTTPAGASGDASGACALLTTQEIQQATSNTVSAGVPDDSQAAAGEQHCGWTMNGSGAGGSGGLAGTLAVNLETGANAVPNFAQLRTGSIQHETVAGVGDDAVLTAGTNLFVKKGDKVIEISYVGVPTQPVKTILTQLAQQAITRL